MQNAKENAIQIKEYKEIFKTNRKSSYRWEWWDLKPYNTNGNASNIKIHNINWKQYERNRKNI